VNTAFVKDAQGRPVGLDWTVHNDGGAPSVEYVVERNPKSGEVKVKRKSRRRPPEEHKPMGPPRKAKCGKGHDLEIHGRQIFTKDGKKNGRDCNVCRRERQRVGNKESAGAFQ
jgi:hypothetical protein